MYWASYQLNAEPHYRLIFEGGADGMNATELRIQDSSGVVLASAGVVPAESEALRLCGGGIPANGTGPLATAVPTYRPGLFGPLRATVPVTANVFESFIADPGKFKIEMRVGSNWMLVAPTNLCHAQE